MATELFIIVETGDCVILGQVLIGYKFVFEYTIQPSPKSLFLCVLIFVFPVLQRLSNFPVFLVFFILLFCREVLCFKG